MNENFCYFYDPDDVDSSHERHFKFKEYPQRRSIHVCVILIHFRFEIQF